MNTEEERIARRRRMAKERKARWLAKQSQESLDRIRAVDAAAYRRRIESETPSEAQNRKESHARVQRLYIERQSPAQSQNRREVNARVHRNRIEAETPAQTQARRKRDAEAHRLARYRQRIRDEAIYFVEAQLETHNYEPMNINCQFCKSNNLVAECSSDGKFTGCCSKGKVKLEEPPDVQGN